MQLRNLTLGPARWYRCVVGRNPLVRRSDRREALALLLLVAAALIAVPLALVAGGEVYDHRVQQFAAQRLTSHEVPATASADSTPANVGYSKYHYTPVQWKVGNELRTDELRTPYTVKAGEFQIIWVDGEGNHVPAPLTGQDAGTEALAVAVGLWLAVTGPGAAGAMVLRRRLNRSRDADWDRALADLADDGGRTNHDG